MSDILGGHRAKVGYIDATGQVTWVGLYSQVSFGVEYSVETPYILGRYGPAASEYTGMSPVSFSASGWRVLNRGPFADLKVPKLQDLLNFQNLTFGILDRKNPGVIVARFVDCKPRGFSSGFNNRALSELSVPWIGLRFEDESGTNSEDGGAQAAAFLP